MAAEQTPIAPIHEFAPAKVNLYLHVTGRREDGYHLLDSLVMFADVGDQITIAPSDILTLDHAGPFGGSLPDPADNLIMRAAMALRDMHGISADAHLTLTKNLPVASGIGGGSTDAAAALRGLCQLWDIDPTSTEVMDLALSLGADVPVCLRGRSTIMRGIGEDFTDVDDCPRTHAILVNPGVGVSTPSVFKARSGDFSSPVDWEACHGETLAERLGSTRNDLEPPAVSLSSVIADVLSALTDCEGVQLARMSGSGATCFGLFPSKEAAQAAATQLIHAHPDWWATATIFGP